MKLLLVLLLCGLAAAAPKTKDDILLQDIFNEENAEDRNILVNLLIRQLFAYIRYIINNGSSIFNIPPLDPLKLDEYHLFLPAGIINLDMELKNALVTGFGGFVVHTSNLRLSDLSFDLEISVPKIDIYAEEYSLTGDFWTAIPLYGKGKARFIVEQFKFKALLFLKQSEDEQSVLIDRIENTWFEIPVFSSNLSGVIGGGDIDAIVNAIVEDVIMGYVNRFQSAISKLTSLVVVAVANPLLDQLNTWSYLEILL